MHFEPSDIATGREALQEFLVPERISVNAMVQNRIASRPLSVSAYIPSLFRWINVKSLLI